ncbi:MAG: GTP-binding protein, partial [Acidiferrobacterales bacterium]
DILVETNGRLIPLKVKLSSTPTPAMASGIRAFCKDLGDRALPGYVIHPGNVRLPLGLGALALAFTAL